MGLMKNVQATLFCFSFNGQQLELCEGTNNGITSRVRALRTPTNTTPPGWEVGNRRFLCICAAGYTNFPGGIRMWAGDFGRGRFRYLGSWVDDVVELSVATTFTQELLVSS